MRRPPSRLGEGAGRGPGCWRSPGGADEPLGDGARKLADDRSGVGVRLGETLSGPGVDRDDVLVGAHQMLRFLELNRRGRRTASRCCSTAFACWVRSTGCMAFSAPDSPTA